MINFKDLYDCKKAALLVHGRHLEAKGWSSIVFGDFEGKEESLGQLTLGLEMARAMQIELLVLGTGASEKDGLKESEYTLHEALKRAGFLVEFLKSLYNTVLLHLFVVKLDEH